MHHTAETVAAEISRILPNLTVHDITHLDALWETADVIAGETLDLSPTEAYILGAAFLAHDLGLGAVPHADGIATLKRGPAWDDLIASTYVELTGRPPEIGQSAEDFPQDVLREAEFRALRESHAQSAARLCTHGWRNPEGEVFHLIADDDLRLRLGPLIGALAQSHGQDCSELPDLFDKGPFSLPGTPTSWTIHRLKLACLLRLADAAQIDVRRAPPMLRALRYPSGTSGAHWKFQERLERPHAVGEKLVYTSVRPFERTAAREWWSALEMLRGIDEEFKRVDSLLYDLGLQRFAVRGVAGVDSPTRFRTHLPTDGWLPVDASIRITDVPHLVEQLGGRALYGNKPHVGIRELVQNAIDAIEARDIVDHDGAPGVVSVRLNYDQNGGYHVEVADNGVGMSLQTLTGSLLDFGKSLWGSDANRFEHPGLPSSSYRSIGQFGIGFYSVFLLGAEVKVRTNHYEQGANQTSVLEFVDGVRARPLIRDADRPERLVHGGTVVSVKLDNHPDDDEYGLFTEHFDEESIEDLCRSMFPGISVTLDISERWLEEDGGDLRSGPARVLEGGDWTSLKPGELFDRLYGSRDEFLASPDEFLRLQGHFAALCSDLWSEGRVVGRLAVATSDLLGSFSRHNPTDAVLCVEGIRADTAYNYVGVLFGVPRRAARDSITPLPSNLEFTRWAQQQAELVLTIEAEIRPVDFFRLSEELRSLGAISLTLPLVIHRDGPWSVRRLHEWLGEREEVQLIDLGSIHIFNRSDRALTVRDPITGLEIELHEDVIAVEERHIPRIFQGSWNDTRNFRPKFEYPERTDDAPEWKRAWARISDSSTGDVVRAASNVWATEPEALMQRAELNGRYLVNPPRHDVGMLENGSVFRAPSFKLKRKSPQSDL